MGHFVSLDGSHGFWVGHSFYSTWLRCLAHHIALDGEDDSLEGKIVLRWLYATQSDWGIRDFGLDRLREIAAAPRGKEIMRAAVTSFREALARMPDPFQNDVLALIEPGDWKFGAVPQTEWLALCAAFLDLIDGKVTNKVGDRIDVLEQYRT